MVQDLLWNNFHWETDNKLHKYLQRHDKNHIESKDRISNFL